MREDIINEIEEAYRITKKIHSNYKRTSKFYFHLFKLSKTKLKRKQINISDDDLSSEIKKFIKRLDK